MSCFSRQPEGRRRAAAGVGCEPADSYESILADPRIEAVVLATPNQAHADQAVAAATAGIRVFVEKPIAYSLADARRMGVARAAAGTTLMVGHAFRRLGAARAAGKLVALGALGTVVLVEANFSLTSRARPGDWRYRRTSTPDGLLMQLGIHSIDTVASWMGAPESVWGSFARVATGAEIDDVAVAAVTFAGGARAVFTGSYVSPPTYSIRVYGTEAVLEYQVDMGVWPDVAGVDAATTLMKRGRQDTSPVAFEQRDMCADELEEFAACIRGERTPETGVEGAISALAVVLGALESESTGRRVQIS